MDISGKYSGWIYHRCRRSRIVYYSTQVYYFLISSLSSSISRRLSTTIVYPALFGWMRSSWFKVPFRATHSRRNGINGRLYSWASFGNMASYFLPYSHQRLSGALIPARKIGIFLNCIFSMICLRFFSISSVGFHWKASLAPIQRMMRDGDAHSRTKSVRERSQALVSPDTQAFWRV